MEGNTGAGACIGPHRCADGFGRQICISICLQGERIVLRFYNGPIFHSDLRAAGDGRGNDRAIDSAGESHRRTGQEGIKAASVL